MNLARTKDTTTKEPSKRKKTKQIGNKENELRVPPPQTHFLPFLPMSSILFFFTQAKKWIAEKQLGKKLFITFHCQRETKQVAKLFSLFRFFFFCLLTAPLFFNQKKFIQLPRPFIEPLRPSFAPFLPSLPSVFA